MSETSGTKRAARRFGVEQAIPLAAATVALFFLWLGLTKYGFWSDQRGPLPGFVPVVVSALAFLFSWKEKAPTWPRESWAVVLSGALIIAGTAVIGLLPSVAIYLVVWLRLYEKCSWKTTLITFTVIMAIVIGCFVLWLGVRFPQGLILDAILRK